jgi:hypothetical protein
MTATYLYLFPFHGPYHALGHGPGHLQVNHLLQQSIFKQNEVPLLLNNLCSFYNFDAIIYHVLW